MNLIFLFSLPRSGSTLLQRIIAAHESVSTLSETKLLLPLVYTLREKGIYTDYTHASTVNGIADMYNQFPNGKADYLLEIRNFVLSLYAKNLPNGSEFFLDKATRYSYIVDEINEIFPDAKYIYLWRNPLSVISSIMTTWADGRWNLYHYYLELFDGLSNMISGCYEKYRDNSIAIRYESLLKDPGGVVRRIDEYLGIPFNDQQITGFDGVNLSGRLGDPTGVNVYKSLSKEPLDKWKSTLNNPFRKSWSRSYLKWIGEDRLRMMGYDLDTLISEIDSLPMSHKYIFSDVIDRMYGVAFCMLEPRINKHKLQKLPNFYRITAHR